MAKKQLKGKQVEVLSPVMRKNNEIAAGNREFFERHGVLAVNFISSPGSGKTTLLEAMAKIFGKDLAVIEGDVQTARDADRVRKAGCNAVQIETGGACHLDASRVESSLPLLELENKPSKILVIENVGNLVCPASYFLGEHLTAALLSLPEGDDKVLKYPAIFSRIDVLLLTKMDLVEAISFDTARAVAECESLNDDFVTFKLSAKTGEGVEEFCRFLLEKRSGLQA